MVVSNFWVNWGPVLDIDCSTRYFPSPEGASFLVQTYGTSLSVSQYAKWVALTLYVSPIRPVLTPITSASIKFVFNQVTYKRVYLISYNKPCHSSLWTPIPSQVQILSFPVCSSTRKFRAQSKLRIKNLTLAPKKRCRLLALVFQFGGIRIKRPFIPKPLKNNRIVTYS